MLIRVDPASSVPLFAQIAASIRTDIVAGRIGAAERLPAARDVAQSLQINVHTVLHAYQDLRDEGLIELRRGRGAIVTDAAAKLTELSSHVQQLAALAKKFDMSADALASLVKEARNALV